jgi:hypothetical protein
VLHTTGTVHEGNTIKNSADYRRGFRVKM